MTTPCEKCEFQKRYEDEEDAGHHPNINGFNIAHNWRVFPERQDCVYLVSSTGYLKRFMSTFRTDASYRTEENMDVKVRRVVILIPIRASTIVAGTR